jgi:hypothetical protein
MIGIGGPHILGSDHPDLAIRALAIQREWTARQWDLARQATVLGWPSSPATVEISMPPRDGPLAGPPDRIGFLK